MPTDRPGLEGADLTNLVGAKLGNYRLERLVGHGRMGVVYLAKDEALLRPTAIKILSWRVDEAHGQDPVQWFLAEARLVARINHPGVVQIYGAARQDDHCYIAMEYVPGASAEAVVTQGGPMAPETATGVLIQAASALRAAHRSGVVHRDVKPANLLIRTDGIAKIGDFGMALGAAEFRTGTAHLRVGTPYYIAPEIWRGETATALSDLYSLGATYFHLLTGRPPYPSSAMPMVEQGHLHGAIPDPREIVPGLPSSCAALVRRTLAKAPRDRHGSARELLWNAQRVLQDLVSAKSFARPSPSPLPARRGDPAVLHPSRIASGPLAEKLGFARQPFSEVDPVACPYQGEPFASARKRILECVGDAATSLVAVTGPEGSGRTLLCRSVASELSPSRTVLVVDALHGPGEQILLQQLCRVAGITDSAEDLALDALVDRLRQECRQTRHAPLVILDGIPEQPPSTAVLSKVLGAALWTRSFKVLLTGSADLVDALARAGVNFHGERVPEIPIPPLDGAQIAGYLQDRLAASRVPGAPSIIFSPDALLLVSLRSEGKLARVNPIAENMLLLAAIEGTRVLTSWHAWVASDQDRWACAPAMDALPRRPERWPPPDVIDVIDACRRGAGLTPWPRQIP